MRHVAVDGAAAGRRGSDLATWSSCVSGARYHGEYDAWRRAVMRARAYYREQKQSKYGVLEVPKHGGGQALGWCRSLPVRVQQYVTASCWMRLRALWGVGSCLFVLNTSYGIDMRCRENILVGRKHMVEVEGRMFKCVPGRWARRRIWSSSSEI